jgi:tRNA A37 threonylcarbamoyltransferase TsaD
MLQTMCEDRGGRFYVPAKKFLGDNGTMIAYLGLLMLNSDNTTPLDQSQVRSNYRPDDVDVTWRN